MARSKKPPHRKGQRKCIFCGGTGMAGEHIYPEWIHLYLDGSRPAGRTLTAITPLLQNDGQIGLGVRSRLRKNERTRSTKIKVVCKTCNNGWMSALETSAREHLIPLLLNSQHVITPEAQQTVATWATLKFMVIDADWAPQNAMLPSDYLAFGKAREIPAGLQIWIAPMNAPGWAEYYNRSAGGFRAPPSRHEGFNVMSITLGIEHVFFHGVFSRVSFMKTDMNRTSLGPRLLRIWPNSNASVCWPVCPPLTQDAVTWLDQALRRHSLPRLRPERTRVGLQIRRPPEEASVLTFSVLPCFTGNEFVDIGCGACDATLGQGISPETLGERFSVPSDMLIRCPRCGLCNYLPVKGSQRKRPHK